MRYLVLKPENEAKEGAFKASYKTMFEAVLGQNMPLSTADFNRLSKVYNKFADLKDGDVLEVEDQDFEVVKKKLNVYVSKVSEGAGFMIKEKVFQEFVEDVEGMPNKKPEAKG